MKNPNGNHEVSVIQNNQGTFIIDLTIWPDMGSYYGCCGGDNVNCYKIRRMNLDTGMLARKPLSVADMKDLYKKITGRYNRKQWWMVLRAMDPDSNWNKRYLQ